MKGSIKFKKYVAFIPLSVLLVYCCYAAQTFHLHDFSNAYFGALLIEKELFGTAIYDAIHFNETIKNLGYEKMFLAYYPNTPFLAFFFQPLLIFNSCVFAKTLFNFFSVIIFLIALSQLKKLYNPPNWCILTIPLIFFISLRNNIYFGQVYFLLFFLITQGLVFLSKGKKIIAAILWSLAIMLKVFPIFLCLLLLFRKDLKSMLFLFIACIFWAAISLSSVNLSDWYFYFSQVLPKSLQGVYFDGFTPAAKSFSMFLRILFLPDDNLNENPLFLSPTIYAIAGSIYKTFIIAAIILVALRSKGNLKKIFPVLMIGIMLLSPGWSSYAAIFLIFIFFKLWAEDSTFSTRSKVGLSCLIFVYCNIPVQLFYNLPLLLKFPKVYLLLSIFCAVVFFAQSNTISWAKFTYLTLGIFFFFMILNLPVNYQKTEYALNEEKHILITDFKVKDKKLMYNYWNVPQPGTQETNIAISSFDSSFVSIEHNQLFYKDKQLTDDNSLKRNAVLVNKKDIYYLSDKNRGMGFFTIMKMRIKPEDF